LNAGDFAQASDVDGIHFDKDNHLALANAITKKVRDLS